MTRQRIKEVALEMFAREGFNGVSVKDIATVINIKAPSVYSHFAGKEELFTEIFYDLLEKKLNNINDLAIMIQSMETRDQLLLLIRDYHNWMDADDSEVVFWKWTAFFPPAFLKDKIRQELIRYESEYIKTLLAPVYEAGVKNKTLRPLNLENFVMGFISLMGSSFSEIHYSTPEGYRKKIDMLWDNFWYLVSNHEKADQQRSRS